ncbi:MAG: hypothetical protein M1829_005012 [Trizodia sp. TS-e1964]|nr:MAG: hypothetical protein M1829_005012 [Trizodia sp. TS-e1964]
MPSINHTPIVMEGIAKDHEVLSRLLASHRAELQHTFKRPRTSPPTPYEPSPFLRVLPAELRAQIYMHALISPLPIDFCPPPDTRSQVVSAFYGTYVTAAPKEQIDIHEARARLAPALLRTSRRIRDECFDFFYSCNVFQFSRPGCWPVLANFLDTIGSNTNLLQRVTIGLPMEEPQQASLEVPNENAMRDAILRFDGGTWGTEFARIPSQGAMAHCAGVLRRSCSSLTHFLVVVDVGGPMGEDRVRAIDALCSLMPHQRFVRDEAVAELWVKSFDNFNFTTEMRAALESRGWLVTEGPDRL